MVVGAGTRLDIVWNLADSMNALMAIPNLIAILLLTPKVLQLTGDYLGKQKGSKEQNG